MNIYSNKINITNSNIHNEITIDKKEKSLKAPSSWQIPKKHFCESITNPWYKMIFRILGQTVYATNDFFRELNYTPTLMLITTGAVSSSMGLGSDSLPIQRFVW